jgi:hypothetical protein
MQCKAIVLVLIALTLISCASAPMKESGLDKAIEPRASWLAPFDKIWERDSGFKNYSILRIPNPKRYLEDTLRFEVRPNEPRALIFTNDLAIAHSERWYGLSVYFPEPHPQLKANISMIFAEWIGAYGNKWDQFNPISLIALMFDGTELSISVHGKKYHNSSSRLLGRWNDFVIHAKWSSAPEEGLIEVWFDGRKILNYRGITTRNEAEGAFFRFGINRDETRHPNVAYFNEVRTGDSFEAVSPTLLPLH